MLIVLMTILLRLFVSPELENKACRHAEQADAGHQHHAAASANLTFPQRLTSTESWSDVAHNFRGDWQMRWTEITVGFPLAGFIGLLGNDFFNGLFISSAPALPRTLENVVLGPIVAVLSFVCSIGNVPLAAVLWSGGISLRGVIAFLLADLIVLPINAIYLKYYGTRFALRITALMFVTIVISGLIIDARFNAAGLVPTGFDQAEATSSDRSTSTTRSHSTSSDCSSSPR